MNQLNNKNNTEIPNELKEAYDKYTQILNEYTREKLTIINLNDQI